MSGVQHYENIVVGAGISGMTAALLLALNGRQVLLIERGDRIGGLLCRFSRAGVPYDTGFHFTSGMQDGGLLDDSLRLLGIRDAIRPVFLPRERAVRYVFQDCGLDIELPCGLGAIRAKLKEYFPEERAAIDGYIDRLGMVQQQTDSTTLAGALAGGLCQDDYVSLQSVLEEFTGDEYLKAVMSGCCVCCGVKPSEISFANYARIGLGLYESVARIENGGQAIADAFEDRLREIGVEVRTGTWVEECLDVREKRVGRFRLNTGQELSCDACVFTIHPRQILDVLPRQAVSKAFVDRVQGFENTFGFFSVYATLRDEAFRQQDDSPLVSMFTHPDLERQLTPGHDDESALFLVVNRECTPRGMENALTVLEPSFADQLAVWSDSTTGRRPVSYKEYKDRRLQTIISRVTRQFPDWERHIRVLDTASMLTYRDYLSNPDGAAYGIKQKIGQFNVRGMLPLRNVFVAGQSSLLPGIVGSTMSSYLVCRDIIGRDRFDAFAGALLKRA